MSKKFEVSYFPIHWVETVIVATHVNIHFFVKFLWTIPTSPLPDRFIIDFYYDVAIYSVVSGLF